MLALSHHIEDVQFEPPTVPVITDDNDPSC